MTTSVSRPTGFGARRTAACRLAALAAVSEPAANLGHLHLFFHPTAHAYPSTNRDPRKVAFSPWSGRGMLSHNARFS